MISDAPIVGKVSREAWADVAQYGELLHQEHFLARNPGYSTEATDAATWARFGLAQDAFHGLVVADIGCGATLRAAWFTDTARLIAIEPLALRYDEKVPWHRLGLASCVYALPAEEFIPELEGKLDVVVSINALDHGYDFQKSVQNIADYLVDGHGLRHEASGRAFLEFDVHEQVDKLHPLKLTLDFCHNCFAEAGLTVEKNEQCLNAHMGNRNLWHLRKAGAAI